MIEFLEEHPRLRVTDPRSKKRLQRRSGAGHATSCHNQVRVRKLPHPLLITLSNTSRPVSARKSRIHFHSHRFGRL
jgi:hypothetical protein